MARVKITLTDGTVQVLTVEDGFKLGSAVLALESLGQWVLIKHDKGEFSARAGEVKALYLERDGDS